MRFPGMRAVIQDLSQSGFTAQRGFPVEFSVRGPDWDKLISLSQEMMGQAGRQRHWWSTWTPTTSWACPNCASCRTGPGHLRYRRVGR